MIDLIKFEINKIFSKKVLWILMAFILWSAISPAYNKYKAIKPKQIDSMKKQQELLAPYEGEIITKEGIKNVEKESKELMKKDAKEYTAEEYIKLHLIGIDYVLDIDPTYLVNDKEYKLDNIKNDINNLKKEGNTDTFEYKNLTYVYDLINKKESPKFYSKYTWLYSTEFYIIGTLLSTMVAFGVSTIFSNDYQSNSASIVLSSREGKGKLVVAKIVSALLFSTLIFIVTNSAYLIYTAMNNFKGWDVPLNLLNSYESTPFNINIANFYIRALGVSFIGIVLFTLLTILISLFVKNNMIATLVTLGTYYVPSFLAPFMPTKELSKIFYQLNIAEVTRIRAMFSNTHTYNIFGNPVLYPNLIITLAIIAIPVVMYMIMYFGKRQTL
jgi:hypothetical protein